MESQPPCFYHPIEKSTGFFNAQYLCRDCYLVTRSLGMIIIKFVDIPASDYYILPNSTWIGTFARIKRKIHYYMITELEDHSYKLLRIIDTRAPFTVIFNDNVVVPGGIYIAGGRVESKKTKNIFMINKTLTKSSLAKEKMENKATH